MKKKLRRNQTKHPSLKPQYNTKIRQEYLDQDYSDKLTNEEKDFLDKFNHEFYGATLDYKNLDNNLHNTKILKKNCTDRNNAQNRCMHGIARAKGLLDYNMYSPSNVENSINANDCELNSDNIEDIFAEYLDSKKENQ